MIRRLRCLGKKHEWEPDAKKQGRYECSRCGAHVSTGGWNDMPASALGDVRSEGTGGLDGGGGGGGDS
jgi:hypothetical protein